MTPSSFHKEKCDTVPDELKTSAWYTHHCTAVSLIAIGCLGAMQTRSSDVMHHRIVTPTSGRCTILPSAAGTERQFSADMLINCLCISPTALVFQPPFCRKRPLFCLQWVKKLRVINPALPAKAAIVQKAAKRQPPTSQGSTQAKKSCTRNTPVSTCMHSIPTVPAIASTMQTPTKSKIPLPIVSATRAAVNVPAPGSDKLKAPPSVAWLRLAIATLQRYTSITIVDRSSNPQPINSVECQEIYPHVLDKVTGDGHCGFRALAKSITGTDSNHAAIRAAVAAFMRQSCSGRRRPWIVNTKTIADYIQLSHMDTTG